MPTGYTAPIKDGITFKQFALQCARAFGACIMMRDEPSNAEIPDEFKPDNYAHNAMLEAQKRMDKVKKMTDAQCAKESKKEYSQAAKYHNDKIKEDAELEVKYETMLAEVEKWTPPTPDHQGMKKFMREQITDSIKFDCGSNYHHERLAELRQLSANEWRQKEVEKCLEEIQRNARSQREENDRSAQRTAWVKNLRDSL
jgi:hypothetical protein